MSDADTPAKSKGAAKEAVELLNDDAALPERILLPDEAWKVLPRETKEKIYSDVLDTIYGEIDAAIEGGTFAARDDFHLSWVPLDIDEAAWTNLTALLEEMLNRLMDLKKTTATRLAKDGVGKGRFKVTVAILGFESPPDEHS